MTPQDLLDATKKILNKHQRPIDRIELKINYKNGTDVPTGAFIQFRGLSSYTLIKINYTRKFKQVYVHLEYEPMFRSKLLPFEYSSTKSDSIWLHVDITSPDQLSYIEDVICQSYDDSPLRDSFGCCSRYIQCSDAGKCLHPDLQYAKACLYRKNLEAGRIFYGINKNV